MHGPPAHHALQPVASGQLKSLTERADRGYDADSIRLWCASPRGTYLFGEGMRMERVYSGKRMAGDSELQ